MEYVERFHGERGSSRRNVTLIITHSCNISCSYCYEQHKSGRMMALDLALRLVAHELRQAEITGAAVLHVKFMGGEQFLNFAVIRGVVDWLASYQGVVRWEASAMTNGTILTDEIKRWLVSRQDRLKVQLSYDGGVEQQLRNRTTLPVDCLFFLDTYPVQGVHITISKQTLPSLSDSVWSILRLKGRCSTTLAFGTVWTDEDERIYRRELSAIASGYLSEFSNIEPIPTLWDSLTNIGGKQELKKSCGNGVTYDVNGSRYLCHFFSPVVVGAKRAVDMEFLEKNPDFGGLGGCQDTACSGCPLCNWCPSCFGKNYLLTGSTAQRDKSMCRMKFVEAFAASEFQIRYYLKNGVSAANAAKAKAAAHAYKVLRDSYSCCYNSQSLNL